MLVVPMEGICTVVPQRLNRPSAHVATRGIVQKRECFFHSIRYCMPSVVLFILATPPWRRASKRVLAASEIRVQQPLAYLDNHAVIGV